MEEKMKEEILKYYMDNGSTAQEFNTELANNKDIALRNLYQSIKNAGIQAFHARHKAESEKVVEEVGSPEEDKITEQKKEKTTEEQTADYNSMLKYLEEKIPNFYYHSDENDVFVNRSVDTLTFLKDAVMQYTETVEYKERIKFLEEEIKIIEEKLEDLKEQYAQEINEQHKLLKQNIDLVNNHAAQQCAVLNREIKAAKDSIEAYEKLKKGQPEKVKELEERWSELFDKIEELKEDAKTNEKEISTYSQEKESIEWPLVFHTENVEYLEQKINEEQERIKQAETKKEQLEVERVKRAKELQAEFYAKYGSPQKVAGKTIISMEKYPPYIKLKAKIAVLKDRKAVLENPQSIYETIQQMMEQKKSPKEVRVQLNYFASILDEDTVKGTLPWLGDTQERLSTSIEGLTQEQERLTNKLAGENGNEYANYFKQEEFIKDKEIIKKYEAEIIKDQHDLETLQKKLSQYHEQKTVRVYKQELRKLQRQITKRENEQSFVATTEEERKILAKVIEKLYEQENALRTTIRQLSSLNVPKTDWKLKKKIEEKNIRILENTARIKVLKEKSEKDYLDIEARAFDQQLLKHVNAFIKLRTKDKEYSETQQLDELVSLIMIDYSESLEKKPVTSNEEIKETEEDKKIEETKDTEGIQETEEIDKYEDAKPSLLDKIRNIHFKEKMLLALTTIATAATTFFGVSTPAEEVNAEETSPSIEETENDSKVEVTEEKKETVKKEKVETSTEEMEEESNFERDFGEAFADYKQAEQQKETVPKQEIDYLELLKKAAPGRFYIMLDESTLEIPMYEVENYFNQGYEVVTCVEYDDGTIGFMHVDFTEKQATPTEGMSR